MRIALILYKNRSVALGGHGRGKRDVAFVCGVCIDLALRGASCHLVLHGASCLQVMPRVMQPSSVETGVWSSALRGQAAVRRVQSALTVDPCCHITHQ